MSYYGCVLSTNDELKCWGKYSVSVYDKVHFVFVSLSVHNLDYYTLCLCVYAGANTQGQLGVIYAAFDWGRGDTVGDMGNNLWATTLSLTANPTKQPTDDPTKNPTIEPTSEPTTVPSKAPTVPTSQPTRNPTKVPTSDPTPDPSADPTTEPTKQPTSPTTVPTVEPTDFPTTEPTVEPSTEPTLYPRSDPLKEPTFEPTEDPTFDPTKEPTTEPTLEPSNEPTLEPTNDPTKDPTAAPTMGLSTEPTIDPTTEPTLEPTTMCEPHRNCTECLYMNSGGIQQCACHSVHNRSDLVNDLDHIDDNVTIDVVDCISSEFGDYLFFSVRNRVFDVNSFISELLLLPTRKMQLLSSGYLSHSELPLRSVSWP